MRPPLTCGAKVVSSIFFMCLPEQVVVYGDCAGIKPRTSSIPSRTLPRWLAEGLACDEAAKAMAVAEAFCSFRPYDPYQQLGPTFA